MKTKIFTGLTPANTMQENTLLSLKDDYNRFYDIKSDHESPYKTTIIETLQCIISNEPFAPSRFYFSKLIPLGKVYGFHDCKLISVEINDGHLVFHFKFPVENLRANEVKQLEEKRDSYNNMSLGEFNKISTEFHAILESIRDLDVYISDFSYAFIYELSEDSIKEIASVMTLPESIAFAKDTIQKQAVLRQLRHSIDSMSFEQKKEYWKLNDWSNDLVNGETPSESTLALRAKQQAQSETDYNKTQATIINLLKKVK